MQASFAPGIGQPTGAELPHDECSFADVPRQYNVKMSVDGTTAPKIAYVIHDRPQPNAQTLYYTIERKIVGVSACNVTQPALAVEWLSAVHWTQIAGRLVRRKRPVAYVLTDVAGTDHYRSAALARSRSAASA